MIDIAGADGYSDPKKAAGQAAEQLLDQGQISLSWACRLLGHSRQEYYKRQAITLVQKGIADRAVELIGRDRLLMPCQGTRKLYLLLKQQGRISSL